MGMYYKDGRFEVIPSSQRNDEIVLVENKLNDNLLNTFHSILPYNQETCCFCCKNYNDRSSSFLKSYVIILKCCHMHHISCFINYAKTKYLSNKFKPDNIECPLCNDKSTGMVALFLCYKKLLKIMCNRKKNLLKKILNTFCYKTTSKHTIQYKLPCLTINSKKEDG